MAIRSIASDVIPGETPRLRYARLISADLHDGWH
jgi:hypothetical protein